MVVGGPGHYRQRLGLPLQSALLGVADFVSDGLGAPLGGEYSLWLTEVTVGTGTDQPCYPSHVSEAHEEAAQYPSVEIATRYWNRRLNVSLSSRWRPSANSLTKYISGGKRWARIRIVKSGC